MLRPGGRYDAGVYRFRTEVVDENIAHYRKIGGAHIVDRAIVPFAMTSLDTPRYREALEEVAPSFDGVLVDVGGGDGRNALPSLVRGVGRVVVIDPAADALYRLRERVEGALPEHLERLALVEADARDIPLHDGCAETVVAIESLYYLNEDYERGLAECVRILAPSGRVLLSDRDREGALLMQLLYFGVPALLRSAREGSVWDGPDQAMRTRSFSELELRAIVERAGLEIEAFEGTSLLALILGWLNGNGRIADADLMEVSSIRALLCELGKTGVMRRCHVVRARRRAT